MIANHIHDALAQVRKLQELILDKQSFRGYSGRARMLGAFAALTGALLMSFPGFSADETSHLIGWGLVLAAALVFNYGALFVWFLFNPRIKCNAAMLVPAIDAVPALAIGVIFSVALILKGQFDFLFGVWMCLYGLAHVSYRKSLPTANYAVGAFYMICGALCLLWPGLTFVDPRPMGAVFFVGEMTGGYVLHRNNSRLAAESETEKCGRTNL